MISTYKRYAAVASAFVLALAMPAAAVAQPTVPTSSPQEIGIIIEFTDAVLVIVICGEDWC